MGALLWFTDLIVFLDIFRLHEKNIESHPKRVRFVYPKAGKDANILLIEGIKDGKADGFKIASPLITYHADGSYSEEVSRMLYGS